MFVITGIYANKFVNLCRYCDMPSLLSVGLTQRALSLHRQHNLLLWLPRSRAKTETSYLQCYPHTHTCRSVSTHRSWRRSSPLRTWLDSCCPSSWPHTFDWRRRRRRMTTQLNLTKPPSLPSLSFRTRCTRGLRRLQRARRHLAGSARGGRIPRAK